KILLGIVIPLIIASVWGTFGAPKAAMLLTGWNHLLLEVAVFGLGVLALIYVGKIRLAILFGVILVINKILIYIWHQ
ncbi:MAG TPA: YrdB family protein, partial [Sporolactobacillaceae bacterium]|nr:YrdB family protein [Sporolactobacillaceae bacterium]